MKFSQAKTNEARTELQVGLLKDPEFVKKTLSSWSAATFFSFPDFTREQLVLDRESHGHLHLSQVETEKLISHLVGIELAKRKAEKKYKGSFGFMTHYFGYQGRCAIPTIFDANLAHNYGFTAGVLIQHGLTGYGVTVRGLVNDVSSWRPGAIPLLAMLEPRAKSDYGDNRTIVPSFEVNLKKNPFQELKKRRDQWRTNEVFVNPGPIQFFGSMAYKIPKTLALTTQNYPNAIKKIEELTERIRSRCRFGVPEDTLKLAIM
eukprot:CAMPEP_0176439388 /NCGR_PEP_ID=MMETSP0127-20121128/19911_1 /TAXON_ID=938130 /ORGANISM="Platyophrya macrostoma, Strain WH" /LENGTH=260 /DNA_ID=CAMNT_0017823643 /DNA_START=94 /DNA_END=873 /DNA_ORIENTATION=-